MKKYLNIILFVVVLVGLAVCLGFVAHEQNSVRCRSITINIDHSNDDYFVEEEDIRVMLHQKGIPLIGKRLNDINMSMLEKTLRHNPFVAKAEVFSSIDGEAHIDILQRTPILRVEGAGKDSYYIDKNGVFMPICDKWAARVPVVTGYVYEPYSYGSAKMLVNATKTDSIAVDQTESYRYSLKDSLYTLARFIDDNDFWKALVQQIYVTTNHEFELVPSVGNHTVVLGDLSNMEQKFNKLMLFYRKGLSKTGWDKYSVINLKYRNQIICTKR